MERNVKPAGGRRADRSERAVLQSTDSVQLTDAPPDVVDGPLARLPPDGGGGHGEDAAPFRTRGAGDVHLKAAHSLLSPNLRVNEI